MDKPITVADRDKIVKIMMLTTSNQEKEVLNAVGRANHILSLYKMNWEEFFEHITHPSHASHNDDDGPEPPRQEYNPDGTRRNGSNGANGHAKPNGSGSKVNWAVEIDKIIAKVGAKEFLVSVKRQFMEKGYLTPKQEAAVLKWKR